MGLSEKIKIGETISVLLEKIEDRNVKFWFQLSKHKIKRMGQISRSIRKNEPIMGKITSKCKGGCIVNI